MQVDAHSANVAIARPVRVPDVRAATSGVLGATSTGLPARGGLAVRNAVVRTGTVKSPANGGTSAKRFVVKALPARCVMAPNLLR